MATLKKNLQEDKEGFTILFCLNDIICEEACILTEYIIEEHFKSKKKKKHDRRSRQQNHAILSIIKRLVVLVHMDYPPLLVPN